MKTMTCRQLGGACDLGFRADSFAEIAEMSRKHGAEMFEKGDDAHLRAVAKMQTLMQDRAAMSRWMEDRRREFDALPEDE